MKKPVYKLLDEKGRVLIPLEMRQKAEIEKGDILKVSITKMPHTEQYKDSVYFADKSMKQQFDMAVETAYQESVLTPVLDQDEPEEGMEQEETTGMSMGM